MNWLSLHLEYNGGLSTTAGSFNNAWLADLTYSGQLPADRRMELRFLQSLDLLQRFRRLLARGKTLAGPIFCKFQFDKVFTLDMLVVVFTFIFILKFIFI